MAFFKNGDGVLDVVNRNRSNKLTGQLDGRCFACGLNALAWSCLQIRLCADRKKTCCDYLLVR